MCGIAGIIAVPGLEVQADRLEALATALAHRGPDGQGMYISGTVGLIQVRLAIIDLEGGGQPLFSPAKTALVANGEIYNYLELKADLADAVFATHSDCEPMLHLYERKGIDFVKDLRGMYALALHDPRTDRVILARDPFGIKQLYYAETPEGVVFASEAQALIAAGFVTPAVIKQARQEIFQLQFSCSADSIFPGIRRLLPGEVLVVEQGKIVERHAFPLKAEKIRTWNEDDAIRRFDEVMTDSVLVHQRADVPYGLFLSGGVDSSVLLSLMARLNSTPVLAFSAGFPQTGLRDERSLARTLAEKTGAEFVSVDVTEQDFWTLLPDIAAAVDDPAADYAIIPSYILAREAKKSVKVVLCGEGGDEIFGGYSRYRTAMRPWPFGHTMRRKGRFDPFAKVLREPLTGWRKRLADSERLAQGNSRLGRVQAIDCAEWLPNDLLIKLDRCLMAWGLEGRTPFLDREVAAFADSLPDTLKVRGRMGKWVARRWLKKNLPEAGPFDSKRGFTVPVGDWIGRRPEVGKLVARQPGVAEACHPDAVEGLFASVSSSDGNAGFAAWLLLFYALWHRRHILGLSPVGDVFETLSHS